MRIRIFLGDVCLWALTRERQFEELDTCGGADCRFSDVGGDGDLAGLTVSSGTKPSS